MRIDSNILNDVYKYQNDNYITYKKTSERFYKGLKITYIIAFAYQFLVNIILILGMWFAKKPLESNIIQNTIIATILLLLAFIVMFFKYVSVSFLLNIISIPFELTLMLPGLILNAGTVDIKGAFYWQYLVPMIIILAVSLYMAVISSKERYLIKRDYKKLAQEKYNTQF